jgi:hypothetical protein
MKDELQTHRVTLRGGLSMCCLLLRVTALLIAIGIVSLAKGDEPKQLTAARREFESLQHPTETDRIRYITRLVRLRDSFTRLEADKMMAIDKEVIRHPMPVPSDPNELVKRIAGKWTSPRHQYLYRADGTWTMLPEFEDGHRATHGIWRVERNQFSEGISEADASHETIILLTATDFVWSTRKSPFYMRRGDVFPWRDG